MKNETTFTAGPWDVESGMVQTVAEHQCKTPNCGVHIPIAWMDREPGNGTEPCERDANARLIAAAPDLLAACIAVRDGREEREEWEGWDENLSKAIALVNAAIAKAVQS